MLSFFQGLAEVLLNVGSWFLPFTVLREYERGVLLRLGRFCKEVGPGWIWHWPFGFDEVVKANVAFDTTSLVEQVMTTSDGVSVVLSITVGYRITDIKKFLIDVEDADTVVVDAAAGVLQHMVNARTWEEVRSADFQEAVHKEARKRGFRFGVTLENVYFKSLVKLSLREGSLAVAALMKA